MHLLGCHNINICVKCVFQSTGPISEIDGIDGHYHLATVRWKEFIAKGKYKYYMAKHKPVFAISFLDGIQNK